MAPNSSGTVTTEQMDTLLDFMGKHRDLARGKLRSVEGKVQAKRLWDKICNRLNSMGGSTKTLQQWQKVWCDRKHLTKKAVAGYRRSSGGKPLTSPQLSSLDLKVMSVLEDGIDELQPRATVHAVPEINNTLPLYVEEEEEDPTLQPSRTNSSKQVYVFIEPNQKGSPPTKRPASASSDSSSSSRCTQGKRQSARSRLFRIEEQRLEIERAANTELAAIRCTLQEMCGLLKQYLRR